MKLYITLLLSTLVFGACVTQTKLNEKKVEKIAFSVASVNNANTSYSIVGSSSNCAIKWEVKQAILTHRMNCDDVGQNELWAYLLEMATKLKSEYKKDIYFVRYTTKDFPKQEKFVGHALSQSKIWKKLNTKNIQNPKAKKIANKFLIQVIDKKGYLDLVPKALNLVGYSFKVDQVDVGNFKPTAKNSLVPEDIKVVFKKQNF